MVMFLLAALAVAAQAPATPAQRPTRPSVVDCRLSPVSWDMSPVPERHRFAVLLGAPAPQGPLHSIRPQQIEVYDPSNLLMGHRLVSAYYGEDPAELSAQTDRTQPVSFRLSVSLPRSTGSLSRNDPGTEEEQRARFHYGQCSISQPPDPVARFNEIRAGQ